MDLVPEEMVPAPAPRHLLRFHSYCLLHQIRFRFLRSAARGTDPFQGSRRKLPEPARIHALQARASRLSRAFSFRWNPVLSFLFIFYFLFMVNSWFYSVLVVTHMRKCQLWIIWVDKLVGLTWKWLWNEISYTLRVELAFIWRIRIAPDHDF